MGLINSMLYHARIAYINFRDWASGSAFYIEGGRLHLPLSENPHVRAALRDDRYERDEREMIKAWLPPDLPAIELGGSYGIVSFTIRRCLLPGQRLVVVEANPQIVPVCRGNVEQAGAVEATAVVHAALAYGGATVRFRVNDNVHISQLVFDGQTGPDIVDVPSANIASLRSDHGISGPFSLICDIEGAELLMLRNDAQALADCRMIIMETHPTQYAGMGGSLDEVLSRLRDMGFEVFNKRSDVIAARRA